jgi:predicted acylesterase/phospholipase RssA
MKNLAFEGGGVKAYGYVGALRSIELETTGKLAQFTRFAGTSAGALFATMMAGGFTFDEIESASNLMDFTKLETNTCCLTKVWNLWRNMGMHTTQNLEKQLESILKLKFDPTITTLKDLFKLTGHELVIVATSLNRRQPIYFHHATYPNMLVIDVLTASMCFPGFFQPKQLKVPPPGNPTGLLEQDLFVDGGTADNYPIWVFNDMVALYAGLTPESLVDKNNVPRETLGLKLLSVGELNTTSVFSGRTPVDGLAGFATCIIDVLTMQVERSNISLAYIRQTIGIDTKSISTLDFSLTKSARTTLENAGSEAVEQYFMRENITLLHTSPNV